MKNSLGEMCPSEAGKRRAGHKWRVGMVSGLEKRDGKKEEIKLCGRNRVDKVIPGLMP